MKDLPLWHGSGWAGHTDGTVNNESFLQKSVNRFLKAAISLMAEIKYLAGLCVLTGSGELMV